MHLGRKKIEKQAKIRGKEKKLLPKRQIKHEHGQKKQEKVCPKDTLICIWAEKDIDYRLEETIIKEIDRKIKEKELLLSKIDFFMNNVTEGGLKYQQKNEKTYYYHQKKNVKTGRWEKIYIKKEQMSLAKELAQKAYFASVRTELKKQINQLRNFIKKYNDEAIDEIYSKLPEERKALVEPVSMGVKEKIDEWNNEIYETYQGFSDNMIYETDQGEMVRSKSEVIIANVLYQHREDIEYKYERPLELKTKEGKSVTIHPDFTIINKKTGKIYYYEHAGRIDESRYAMDFVRKMNLYSNNNILQGMDLMVTYETNSMPLDINCVKRIVRSILDE